MASTNVGKWSVTAGVDAGAFGTGVNAMTRDTARMERSVKKGFTGMEQAVDGALGGVGASISLFGMRVGFQSLTMASVVNTVKQAWQTLGETLDQEIDLAFLNDQLGTTIEWLSSMRTAASENSVSTQQFTAGMERLNQQLGQARLGSTEALGPFLRLGLTLEQIQGDDFQDTFMRIARALADMPDRATRARTAMELFGRGGAAGMLRLVDDIDANLADITARGGFTTEADLERFQRLNTSIDRMSTAWANFKRETLGSVADEVSARLERLHDASSSLLGLLRQSGRMGFAQFTTPMEEAGSWLGMFIPESVHDRIDQTRERAGIALEALFTEGRLLRDNEIDTWQRASSWFDVFTNQLAKLPAPASDATQALERFNLEANRLREQNRTAGLLADITESDRIFEQTRNPIEQFEARIERLIFLFNEGNLSADTFGRAVDQALGTLSSAGERRLPGLLTFGSAAAATQVNQTQAQIRDRMDTLIGVSRETRDALRDILRANPEVQGILQGGA